MQDLLSQLSPPIAIGLIVVGAIALAIVVLLVRRLRQRQEPDETPIDVPAIGGGSVGPIDYTSLPIDDEPTNWRERFARLTLPQKILAGLVPVLAILVMIVLILTFLPGGQQAVSEPPPTLEPISLTIEDAALIRVEPNQTINVRVESSGLSEGTEIVAEMLADGEPFVWMRGEDSSSTLRNGRTEISIRRADVAATPIDGVTYTIVVRTADEAYSAEKLLDIPPIYRDAFYSGGIAPTATSTRIPTQTPTEATVAEATETPVTPTATTEALPTGAPLGVANGGNVRSLPIILPNNVVAGINAGETVQVIERTPNAEWYFIRNERDELGWASATLLDAIDPASVPVAPIVTVFVSGAVFAESGGGSTEVDRVNAGEIVELTGKTADGAWYQVTNVRGISGWVDVSLLGIPDEVANSVPVVQ
jgi:hypothetical protein